MVSINGVRSIKARTHASVYFKCTLSLVQRVLAVLSVLIYKWLLEPIHLEEKCWNCLRKLFNTASGDEFTTAPLYSASLPCSGWTYSTHSWRFTPPFAWLTQFVSLPHLSDLYSTRLSLNLVELSLPYSTPALSWAIQQAATRSCDWHERIPVV